MLEKRYRGGVQPTHTPVSILFLLETFHTLTPPDQIDHQTDIMLVTIKVSPSLPSRFHFVRVIHFFPPDPPAILQAKTNIVFTDYVINFLCHPYVYHMP